MPMSNAILIKGFEEDTMGKENLESDNLINIRDMTIDDFAEVFHLGEQLFTSDYSPSMYRTWDEYEVTTLYNSDSELCLVAELDEEIVGFALRQLQLHVTSV